MEPAAFLTRLARTEKLHDEFRTPAFYVVPMVMRDEFLKRIKLTEEELNEAIRKFENEHPKSIWQEDFEGRKVYHVSTFGFSIEKTKIKYVRRG